MPLRSFMIACLLALVSSACAHRPSPALEAEQRVLQQRESAFLAAADARNLEQTMAYFAEDAVLQIAQQEPREGADAIRQFYGNVFRFLGASTATPERLRLSRSADLAYSVGRVRNVFRGETGAVEYAGKYVLVWEKRAGEWQIALYGLSGNSAEVSR